MFGQLGKMALMASAPAMAAKLIGSGLIAIVGLVAIGGLLFLKFSYDSGVRAKEQMRMMQAQERLNAIIAAEDARAKERTRAVYGEYRRRLQDLPGIPDSEGLQQCPENCYFSSP